MLFSPQPALLPADRTGLTRDSRESLCRATRIKSRGLFCSHRSEIRPLTALEAAPMADLQDGCPESHCLRHSTDIPSVEWPWARVSGRGGGRLLPWTASLSPSKNVLRLPPGLPGCRAVRLRRRPQNGFLRRVPGHECFCGVRR